MKLFGRAPFAYTLEPEPLQDPQIDDFLFRTRRGFCEHYAGSFVFLMRAAGMPARVVVGYLGGEVNVVSGDIIVRQSDAHAWAEVWLDGRGWVRVDPTAAVAPQRVERGLAAAVPASEFRSRRAQEPAWLRNVRWGLDGLVSGWNRWVLGYDRSRQARLFAWLGLDAADPRAVLWGVSGLVLSAALPLLCSRASRSPIRCRRSGSACATGWRGMAARAHRQKARWPMPNAPPCTSPRPRRPSARPPPATSRCAMAATLLIRRHGRANSHSGGSFWRNCICAAETGREKACNPAHYSWRRGRCSCVFTLIFR